MKLSYTDPKKKKLQKIEIGLMLVMLPIGLFFGGKALLEYQAFNKAEPIYKAASELTFTGQFEEGIVLLEEALAIYPNYYSAWEDLGLSHHMLGNHKQEIEAYERAVKALPDNGNLHRELATAYHELGEHEKELASASLAVSLPNSDAAFTGRILDRAEREVSGELSTEKVPRQRLPDASEVGDHGHGEGDHGHGEGEHTH